MDVNAYFSYEKQGLEPENPIECKTTRALEFLQDLFQITSSLLELSMEKGLMNEVEGEDNIEDYFDDPSEAVSTAAELLDSCFKVTTDVNPFVNFAWSTRKVTRKYLEEVLCPRIKEDPESLEKIKKIVGLELIFSPEIKDEKKRKSYKMYGYPDYASTFREEGRKIESYGESVGGLLCKLTDLLRFDAENLLDVLKPTLKTELPPLNSRFKEWATEELERAKWEPHEISDKYAMNINTKSI